MILEVDKNRSVEVDREGFLLDPGQWDEEVMEALIKAHEAAGHRKVDMLGRAMIFFVRHFYEDHMHHPSMNDLVRMHGEREGENFEEAERLRDALYEMFPHGPIPMLAKLAGLPHAAASEEAAA